VYGLPYTYGCSPRWLILATQMRVCPHNFNYKNRRTTCQAAILLKSFLERSYRARWERRGSRGSRGGRGAGSQTGAGCVSRSSGGGVRTLPSDVALRHKNVETDEDTALNDSVGYGLYYRLGAEPSLVCVCAQCADSHSTHGVTHGDEIAFSTHVATHGATHGDVNRLSYTCGHTWCYTR
jgi:hypothetical protein